MQESAVIIVGGGTSGLAAAACLSKKSVPYILLEREECVASLWRKYTYDRLHLHLRKQVCELPFLPFPPSYPNYVPREQFIQYLDHYVQHFNIQPLYHRAVESAQYEEGIQKWIVQARNWRSGEVEDYGARFLVVASGETAEPRVPQVEGLEGFKGKLLHSTAYKNGKDFGDENVLVVGSGNSGMEIALDLSNYGAKPSIVVRSPVQFLSREMMHYASVLYKYLSPKILDILMMIGSRVVYGDLTKYGIPFPTEGPFAMKMKYRKFPIIDLGTVNKIKSGEIQVVSAEIEKIRSGNQVVFKNGKSLPFESIIFCTGFKRSTQKWLKGYDELLNEDGFAKPRQRKGKNGLYCVGLAQLGFFGANLDAHNVANDIASLM